MTLSYVLAKDIPGWPLTPQCLRKFKPIYFIHGVNC